MKFNKEMLLLYAVTDRAWVGRQTLYEQIEDALKGGVTMVQLREKNLDVQTFIEEAKTIKELCHSYQVPLIINDNVEVALKSGADGVHLGIEDVPVDKVRKNVGADFIIGATAKTIEQAKCAEAAGADYLGVGAVFPSPTKKNAIRITKSQLKDICQAVDIPAVAIGGITYENMQEIIGGGMDGVALVSAIFAAENIQETTARLKTQAEYIVNAKSMKTALTIAGSDSGGGAGIQADIKTMTTNGVYAMSAITALTAQNTTGVRGIMEVTPAFLAQQIDAVFEDIRPDAVKIGMVSSAELIDCIAERLKYHKAGNIIVDPVMIATSGARLISEDAIDVLKTELLPLATVITPNIPEAEKLANMEIHGKADMLTATKKIGDTYGCAVLCKGGHSINDANDLLYSNNTYQWFEGRRINNPNTHGTGCTLSSAIASNLAKGFELIDSVQRAKEYVSGALSSMLDLGQGSGPMNHGFDLNCRFADFEMSKEK
ncbi:MAG: bifunctional hydroxymethylpyrimidine kinase/phosphomethylpyrimidine kinase [Lachnospiraceae bacterium]|nr:bifunctional hydroxymethylpyrimidine kinase/phosphomethylpyrimidine kinase [Lachnospiraceae bacterium]